MEEADFLQDPQREASVRDMLFRTEAAFTTEDRKFGDVGSEFEANIDLVPGSKPVKQKSRPLHPQKLEDLRCQISAWVDEGVIQRSASPWASPLVPVSKKDGTTRWAVDYRRVNAATVADATPLPLMESVVEGVGGSKVFSTVDSSNAYMAIPMGKTSRPLTAFICHFGLFEFLKLPFGLKNSGAVYSRMISTLVDQLGLPGVIHYLDDILVHSKSFEEHVELVEQVLRLHLDHGLLVKASKSFLFRKEVEFLGNLVGEEGMKTTPKCQDKIASWPRPKTPKELASFVGFIGFYSTFVPRYAEIVAPLNAYKNKRTLEWTPEAAKAFEDIKRAFVVNTGKSHLQLNPKTRTYQGLVMDIDYSKVALSAVLQQEQDGKL